ncbi:MAG: diguanylate cyclase [Candidatus Hydrogenedentota bacterium]
MVTTSLSTTILVVDPTGELRQHVSEHLRSLSYIVLTCSDANEAIQHMSGADPGLVMMDAQTAESEATLLLDALEADHPATPVMIAIKSENIPSAIGGRPSEQFILMVYPAAPLVIEHTLRHAVCSHRVLGTTLRNRDSMEMKVAALEAHIDGVERQNVKLQREHGELTRVTARHRAEIRDRESAESQLERIRLAMDSAQDAMLILNGEGGAEYTNRAFDEFFGKPAESTSVYGLSSIFVDSTMSEKVADNVDVLGTFTCEVPLHNQSGEQFPAMIHANQINFDESESHGVLYIISDITEQEKLRHEAHFDALTGLYGRRHFLELLASNTSLATRHGHPLSVVLCDLDKFKQVNDTFGHRVGDEVLTTFAEVARDEARQEDVVGRIGGDEFILMFPHVGADTAAVCLERIRSRFEAIEFTTESGETFNCAVTMGAADFPANGTSDEEFVELADQALYKAKELGRNCIVVNQRKVGAQVA